MHRVSWKLAEARQGADFNYLRRKGTILWCYPSPGSAVGWQGFSVEIWRVPVITPDNADQRKQRVPPGIGFLIESSDC